MAAHEEPVFHKDVENIDELVLEDDDTEFEDGLFNKPLQQDLQLETLSELPPLQLPAETEEGTWVQKKGP